MTNTYLDDFMDKMITVPNDINRLLRLIRKLDKRAEETQTALTAQQNKFVQQVKELREKKINELTPQMKIDLEAVQKKQKELIGYSKEKKEIADQLYSEVAEYQEMLATELKNKYKDKPEE
jgi:tRNA U34 5-carboxymethylaminomethyl modifying GTPase MnmE/TrmE